MTFFTRRNRFGAACSSSPACCSSSANGEALPSRIGSSGASRSTKALSMPRPLSADIRCSTVWTFAPSLISVDARRASPTSSARAGMSTGEARSMRRNTMPVSGGAGRRVMRTFWPVWRPTPEALINVFRVRCRSIAACILLSPRAPTLRGEVLQHLQAGGPAGEFHGEGGHFDRDHLAALLLMAPDALADVVAPVGERPAQVLHLIRGADPVGGD